MCDNKAAISQWNLDKTVLRAIHRLSLIEDEEAEREEAEIEDNDSDLEPGYTLVNKNILVHIVQANLQLIWIYIRWSVFTVYQSALNLIFLNIILKVLPWYTALNELCIFKESGISLISSF